MTNAPTDLLTVRQRVMAATGLTDPADVGIVGDGIHARTGGYHEGADVLAAIGVLNSDYSVAEYARDQRGLTNSASAMDIALAWPNGGRAAAIRFSNLIVADLLAGTPGTECVRAINYSPDGTTRLRRDQRSGLGAESSSDSVDIHTHFEFWRDTEGTRNGAFCDLLLRRIRQAITGTDPGAPTSSTGEPNVISDVLAPGFGIDENDAYIDPVDHKGVVSVSFLRIESGAYSGGYLTLAGSDSALVRVGIHNASGAWSWQDISPAFATGSTAPIGLPKGTDGLKLARKRRRATDSADGGYVRWTVCFTPAG